MKIPHAAQDEIFIVSPWSSTFRPQALRQAREGVFRPEEVEKLTDHAPRGFDLAGLGFSDQMFEHGEGLLDGRSGRGCGRREIQADAYGPDGGADDLDLVAVKVVERRSLRP